MHTQKSFDASKISIRVSFAFLAPNTRGFAAKAIRLAAGWDLYIF
jgi:hypothetical protein